MLLAVGPAAAATTIGQNDAGGAGTCGTGNTFVQTGTGPGVPSYAVPAGGGVITSWSFQAGSTAGEKDKLKVVRPTGTANQFFVVGEDALQTMKPSALNTFSVRIPVQAGDDLGLYTVDGNDCTVSTHTTGNTDAYLPSSDPSPGTTFTGTPESGSGEAYNVSATVEADADQDGYGDETQDQCPTDASTQGPCPYSPPPPPPPPPVITPPPAPFGGIQLAATSRTVKNGKVTVLVPCPASSQGNCVGTDTLTTAGKVVAPRLTAAKKKKAKVLALGKGHFSIPAGKSAKVTIKLNKTASKLLTKKHTLKVKQTIVAHDSRNLSKKTTGSLNLKAAKTKKKH